MAYGRRARRMLHHLAPSGCAADLKAWTDYPTRADPRQTVHRRDTEAEAAALACLDLFMSTWNARDGQAHAQAFNFPSVRIANHPPATVLIRR